MAEPVTDLGLLRRACAPCSLRQLCQRTSLSEQVLVRSAGRGSQLTRLSRGDTLFRLGDRLGDVFVVRAGALKTTVTLRDGDEHVIGFHLPGELVGLDALASGEHCVEASALVETHLCAVPLNALVAVGSSEPSLNRELLKVFGAAAMESHVHVDVLMRRQAGERLAVFLHGILERYRHHRNEQLSDFTLPMSREDIARYLGLALETVSRGFSRLQDEGVIKVSGRSVTVIALDRLRHAAQLSDTESGETATA
jgi:CRP/FNR family transcriptional regulator, anaerobic regulatory protein